MIRFYYKRVRKNYIRNRQKFKFIIVFSIETYPGMSIYKNRRNREK